MKIGLPVRPHGDKGSTVGAAAPPVGTQRYLYLTVDWCVDIKQRSKRSVCVRAASSG